MKLSIFSNDKTTAKDEIILTLFVLVAVAIGILLVVFRPSFWIIDSNEFVVTGVMLIMIGVILSPSIAYRFMTNTEINKKDNKKEVK